MLSSNNKRFVLLNVSEHYEYLKTNCFTLETLRNCCTINVLVIWISILLVPTCWWFSLIGTLPTGVWDSIFSQTLFVSRKLKKFMLQIWDFYDNKWLRKKHTKICDFISRNCGHLFWETTKTMKMSSFETISSKPGVIIHILVRYSKYLREYSA